MRRLIPINRTLAVVRFISHMTAERRVMPEHRVLQDGLTRAHGFEKLPHMWTEIVIIIPLEADCLTSRFLSRLWIMFRMPLLKIWLLKSRGQSIAVVAGRKISSGLWDVGKSEFS